MKVFGFARFTMTVLMIFCLCGISFADFNAADYVTHFNSLNNGQGYRFTYGYDNEVQLTQVSGTDNFDLSAYDTSRSTGRTDYFRTFCNEPTQGVNNTYKGSLNYNTTTGVTKNSLGYAVKLGTAVLYSQFAAGTLKDYDYDGLLRSIDSSYMTAALRATMGVTIVNNWNSNKYLAQLLAINPDKSYWTSAYNPNQRYDEVGDYAVFALNVYSSTGGGQQDFFFVTSTNYSRGSVPEPATLLLWSISGISLAGASWRKYRSKKK